MYIPKSKIKDNLYTRGNEFILKSNNQNYIGDYVILSNGKYFNKDITQELLIKEENENGDIEGNSPYSYSNNFSGYTLPFRYKNIKSLNLPTQNMISPEYFLATPNDNDYKNGFLFRYFLIRINTGKIIEVNKEVFELYKNNDPNTLYPLFYKESIKWNLNCSQQTQFDNNNKTIKELENKYKFSNIKTYFNNLNMFFKPCKDIIIKDKNNNINIIFPKTEFPTNKLVSSQTQPKTDLLPPDTPDIINIT